MHVFHDVPDVVDFVAVVHDANGDRKLCGVGDSSKARAVEFSQAAVLASCSLRENDGIPLVVKAALAKGIDSYAHFGTIEAKRKTIAVLGNGLDTIYPKENLKLSEKILENEGAIISEYPLGTQPNRENFPARNRIISGLSNGILVVEAKEKSGTLITTDFALDQGRDVFVIPGNIDSENSFGTNELIKQGAKLVTNPKEILEEYQYRTDLFC